MAVCIIFVVKCNAQIAQNHAICHGADVSETMVFTARIQYCALLHQMVVFVHFCDASASNLSTFWLIWGVPGPKRTPKDLQESPYMENA